MGKLRSLVPVGKDAVEAAIAAKRVIDARFMEERSNRLIKQPKDGQDGKDGLNGVSIKSIDLADSGDYYGLKIALSDGDVKSFRIDRPADGKDGLDGKNGERGRDGINGKDGAAGRDGKDGRRGEKGLAGHDGFTPRVEFRQTSEGLQVRVQNAPNSWGAWEEALNIYHLAQVIAQYIPRGGGGSGGGGSPVAVQDDGTPVVSAVATLNFGEGLSVVDDGSNKVTVSADGSGHVIQDEGVDLPQRDKLNFVGSAVTVTDDSGNDASVVTIDAISGITVQDNGVTIDSDVTSVSFDDNLSVTDLGGGAVSVNGTGSVPTYIEDFERFNDVTGELGNPYFGTWTKLVDSIGDPNALAFNPWGGNDDTYNSPSSDSVPGNRHFGWYSSGTGKSWSYRLDVVVPPNAQALTITMDAWLTWSRFNNTTNNGRYEAITATVTGLSSVRKTFDNRDFDGVTYNATQWYERDDFTADTASRRAWEFILSSVTPGDTISLTISGNFSAGNSIPVDFPGPDTLTTGDQKNLNIAIDNITFDFGGEPEVERGTVEGSTLYWDTVKWAENTAFRWVNGLLVLDAGDSGAHAITINVQESSGDAISVNNVNDVQVAYINTGSSEQGLLSLYDDSGDRWVDLSGGSESRINQLRVGGTVSGTLNDWLLTVEGGAGDDQLIRARRGNALGGVWDLQAGSGAVTMWFENQSYVKKSFITAQSNTEEIWYGVGANRNDYSFRILTSKDVEISRTTDSTSVDSGALQILGGAGIAKSLYVGTYFQVGSFNKQSQDQVSLETGDNQYARLDRAGKNGANTAGGWALRQSSVYDRALYCTGNDSVFSFAIGEYKTNSGELQVRNDQVAVAGSFSVGRNNSRVVSGSNSDEDRFIRIGESSQNAAWEAEDDVDGRDVYIRTQSGGAHTSNDPRGADIRLEPGVAGSGGAGRDGRVVLNGPTVVSSGVLLSSEDVTGAGGSPDVTADGSKSVYFLDGSADTCTLALDATPSGGQFYKINCVDSTNTCTIDRNGSTIDGLSSDLILVAGETADLIYSETYGWRIV